MKLIDNGSGGMFVWVIAVDYSKCVVDTTWLDGNNIVASGVLSSGTVTTGTTLFDTANDPTAEMHIGGLEAHGNATFAGNVTIDGSNGSNGIDLLRPTDSAIMQAISAPDSSTLKIGGGNQSYVKIYAHTTEVVEFNNSGNATFVGNIAISGGSKSFSFTSGSGTVKTTTGNSLILQTNSSDGIVIDGSTQNVTIANDLALTGGALSISGDGSNAVTFTESSAGIMTIATPDDFVVDAEGDIAFDANGGDIRLKDGGTQWGSLYTGGGGTHMYIESAISDKDIIFKGNDGGSTITALTLDMSVGGSAFFNHDIVMPDNGKVTFGTGSDLQIYHDASNSYIVDTDVGSLKICAANFHVMNAGATEYMMTGTPDEGVILYYNGSVKFKTTDEGIQIADSNLYLKDGSNIRLETTITTNSDSSGTIINFGGTSVTAGYYYVLNSSSGWEDTQADAEEFSKGLIAVARATGTASSVGMLLEGIYRDASHGFTIGAPLFLSADDNNLVTTTAPSGSSEVVRVMGYAIDANHIYFKPDPTWVVLD